MRTRYRSIFISDVHLGTPVCQVSYLADFLEKSESEYLYLVGDIIDVISMRKRPYFPESHQRIVTLVLEKARQGTKVIYIPGNHDDYFRRFCGSTVAGIELKRNAIHRTLNGRRFFVSHGDEFDQVVRCSPLMLFVGDRVHSLMLALNAGLNRVRRSLKRPYWSLAAYCKSRVGQARQFIERFEQAALLSSERQQVDGYICGHIHFASFRSWEGKLYCNDGDWVEHCSALVEDEKGMLSLISWTEMPRHLMHESDAATDSELSPGWALG